MCRGPIPPCRTRPGSRPPELLGKPQAIPGFAGRVSAGSPWPTGLAGNPIVATRHPTAHYLSASETILASLLATSTGSTQPGCQRLRCLTCSPDVLPVFFSRTRGAWAAAPALGGAGGAEVAGLVALSSHRAICLDAPFSSPASRLARWLQCNPDRHRWDGKPVTVHEPRRSVPITACRRDQLHRLASVQALPKARLAEIGLRTSEKLEREASISLEVDSAVAFREMRPFLARPRWASAPGDEISGFRLASRVPQRLGRACPPSRGAAGGLYRRGRRAGGVTSWPAPARLAWAERRAAVPWERRSARSRPRPRRSAARHKTAGCRCLLRPPTWS